MIERRRLFFGSDFLRDTPQPARSAKYCAVWVCIIKKQWNHVGRSKNCHLNGRHKANDDANWTYRNSLTGSCAVCHIRVVELLCASKQLRLVSLGSCFSPQAQQRSRTRCWKVSLRMPRDIPFKVRMYKLKRKTAAGCLRLLKQIKTVVTCRKGSRRALTE